MVNHIEGRLKCMSCGVGFNDAQSTVNHLKEYHFGMTNGDFGIRHIRIRTKGIGWNVQNVASI